MLVRHLSDAARFALNEHLANGQDRLPSEAASCLTGRLVAFYIDRARSGLSSDDLAVKSAAEGELACIRATLSDTTGIAVPEPAVPTSEPASSDTDSLASGLNGAGPPSLASAVRVAYRLTTGREAVDEEIGIWQGNFSQGVTFPEFLLLMDNCQEARAWRAKEQVTPHLDDGTFIQQVHRMIENRGALPNELDHYRRQFENGRLDRKGLLKNFFARAVEQEVADIQVSDGLSSWIMGTSHTLTLAEWQTKTMDTEGLAEVRQALRPVTPFHIKADAGVRVSAITSVYLGGDFIEQFMDNMTSQTCFDKHCELLIIDADSPENEADTIEHYLRDHPNIHYRRMNSCIGIYEAWNIAVAMAKGDYLTNANLDDLRREDSFEIQAGVLDEFPFVDVVYQDFYYSFDPRLSWEEVAAFGYKSTLPVITHHNMLYFNSPHNAPMWRKSLHDELGLFDASYKSAGDYEFWLRCLTADKMFFKVNEPHVVYYQNPKGLSTRADTRGIVEAKAISRKYAPLLISKELTCDFVNYLDQLADPDLDPGDFSTCDRHIAAQRALRDLARRFKQSRM